jgi:hypothetical protein
VAPTFDEFLARLRAGPDPAPPSRCGPYRSYRALWDEVERVRAIAGGVVETYGRSTGGEPLWALSFGEARRGRVLYLANLHAQELVGTEAALATARLVAERRRAGDPALDGVEVTCVPTANPDGYRRVLADLAAGASRFRRKNLRGVDLNRNFAVGFDRRAPLARLLPWVYAPGPSPLSEAETAALDRLFARRFDRALSFHSFGGWIFWPWAGRRAPTPDDGRFAALAASMRARMRRPYRAVQLGRWARWFTAHGAEIDHLYDRYGTLAFLVEVSRGGRRFAEPGTWLDVFAWFNPRDPSADVADAAAAALALAEL